MNAARRRILVQFAHPVLERSQVNRPLLETVRRVEGVTVNDLYEEYPTLSIDVEREQRLLLEHDVIVFHHPFYWYSTPAILKQWQDMVLEHGWAYGPGGTRLTGKITFNVVTTGGPASAYARDGYNRFTVRELLAPWEQTANLCHMRFLAPYVAHGSLRPVAEIGIDGHRGNYRDLIEALRDDRLDLERAAAVQQLVELIPIAAPDDASEEVLGMNESLLPQVFVYLVVAVLFVPVAKRLGLGAVLGYLIAGAVIGPFVLGLVGSEGGDVMHFAEFGVVMMMFIVGLELRPSLLWELRRPIVLLGGLQVLGCAGALAGGALLLGVHWKVAIAVGLLLSMSSTAIVITSLSERGLLRSRGGQAAFSILLFQDIAVIPILAVFPALAIDGGADAAALDAARPAWQSALALVLAVAAIVLAGRFVVRPIFQFLARVQLRESFIAFALMLVVGIALMMHTIGFSEALGTFMAGVVLADSEYRHELESDIEPFKGLLLGLFFISIGAQIDFGLLFAEPALVLGIVVVTMTLKAVVLYMLGRVSALDRRARWTIAFALPQVGEFAFVLVSFGEQNKVFGEEVTGPLVAAIAFSMAATPLVFVALERWVLPSLADQGQARPHDEITHNEARVVIAGYGRFGQIVGRILRANRIKMTVLDLDPEMVDVLGRLGIKVHYGDASRLDLLEAAGCARAELFVLAIDDAEQALAVAKAVRMHYPKLRIIARARDRPHYIEMRNAGVSSVHRETFASAFEAGIDSLRALGYRAHTAHRLARRWREHEEREIEELLQIWGQGEEARFARSRAAMQEAERLMREEDPTVYEERDAAWDDESLRARRRDAAQ